LANRIELLIRAVMLVAGINLADVEQAAVLTRVVADRTSQRAAAGADPLRNRRIEAEAV
jgi:hypothetical protein